jgi:hypothetical protein
LQQEYQLVWPFETDSVAEELDLGFEMDRDAGMWRTIGTDIEDPGAEELLGESAQRATQSDPSEEDLLESLGGLALDEKDYMWFISHCVNGDIDQATLCLTSTSSAETFLQRRGSNGNIVLALVCMDGHYDMVKFLLE